MLLFLVDRGEQGRGLACARQADDWRRLCRNWLVGDRFIDSGIPEVRLDYM